MFGTKMTQHYIQRTLDSGDGNLRQDGRIYKHFQTGVNVGTDS